ncbi:MAG: hypothetical protein H0X51_03460 [Parachlamydiaceae bacterium]|nr:hypothetical protein [Parachlamydiaceae bacterium]
MAKLIRTFCFFLITWSTVAYATTLKNEKLITIHGFFGSPWNMYFLVKPLEKEQMSISHWGYASRDKKIQEHAEDLVRQLQEEAVQNPGKPINFLTHSMGGLILRAGLNHPDCPLEAKVGRAVLLAPPNQGAVWGRMIAEFSLANYIGRDQSGKELMTERDFEHLGQFPDTMEVMVIAGNFSLNVLIPGENDGTVAVEETYLTTPHQHVIIKQGHKSILLSKQASELAKDFLSVKK